MKNFKKRKILRNKKIRAEQEVLMIEKLAETYNDSAWNMSGSPKIVRSKSGQYFCGFNLTVEMIDGDEHCDYSVHMWNGRDWS